MTLWFWTGTVIATAITGIACVIRHFRTEDGCDHDQITFMIENIMAKFIFYWMTVPRFWSYEVTWCDQETRLALMKNPGAFILAANHSSIIDTLFIALFPVRKTYTYNLKWSRVPVFGWLCLWAGYIGIDTKSEEGKKQIVPRVAERVKQGYSVMVYPEGTRNKHPPKPLLKLKTGAFRVAHAAQRPVLPLVLKNTWQGMSRYGVVDIATMKMIICKPIVPTDAKEQTFEQIQADVERYRQTVEETL